MNKTTTSWENLIIDYSNKIFEFQSRTCCLYNIKSKCLTDPQQLCPCGRMIRSHSFLGDDLKSETRANGNTLEKPPHEHVDNGTHSIRIPFTLYGTLKPAGCKFLRVDNRLPMKTLYELILDDCGERKPTLMLSIYGGENYFTLEERLKNEFITGVIETATITNAWILTNGINNGVSKLVGEGISHYRLLRENPNKLICIGMNMWGAINESMRLTLRTASSIHPSLLHQYRIPDNMQEDRQAMQLDHTHFFLFDSGRLDELCNDSQRHNFLSEACRNLDHSHTCYAVSIIVEGGLNTIEMIENDIKAKRPIILIQGSGRLADVLAVLVERLSTSDREVSQEEIEQALNRFYANISYEDARIIIRRIQNILKIEFRHLLYIFSVYYNINVAQIIFKAIFTATKKEIQMKHDQKHESFEREHERIKYEHKLVDLALEWNYFNGALPILQCEIDEQNSDYVKNQRFRQKELFFKSLEKSRPRFIEYFLTSGFDALTLLERNDVNSYQVFIKNLYSRSYDAMDMSHKNRVKTLFGYKPFRSIRILDSKLTKFVGSFIGPIYSLDEDKLTNRIKTDVNKCLFNCFGSRKFKQKNHSSNDIENHTNHYQSEAIDTNQIEKKYTKNDILRDLFLWSIFMDLPDITKVLLLHVQPRICAALIASAIFKKYGKLCQKTDMKNKFHMQSLEFETYAAMCIDKCYEYSERRAAELLLRQVSLFGNVTCMQVAISSESVKLLETASFDYTVRQVWFNKLCMTNGQASTKFSQIGSILTFGLIAPWFIEYRQEDEYLLNNTNCAFLSQEGIDYYIDNENSKDEKYSFYWTRFQYFHDSPAIKMSYHFISYIFFLLVFSYMMLYHLDELKTYDTVHWTELYVIITILTMSCDEARRIYHEYNTRMTELWGSTESFLLAAFIKVFYILPYLLFYLGLGFRYGSKNARVLSIARIIWALDLELWYLRSLKFVIVFKFFGPKLFMLKNMLRDLFAFLYMILIAIAAYGVVSRSLIHYNQVPFTMSGLVDYILYEPYWFIYGDPSDKDLLDNIIHNDNNDTSVKLAEVAATQFLLAFHMIFVNILILNLLVAVFADTIGKVQQNTEFYWRYQRYSFVREYFERIPLAYPPLTIISHILLFAWTLRNICWPHLNRYQDKNGQNVQLSNRFSRIFKMIPINDSQNDQWDTFVNAATYRNMRSILEHDENIDTLPNHCEKSNRTSSIIEKDWSKEANDQKKELKAFKKELLLTMKSLIMESQNGLKEKKSSDRSYSDQMQIFTENPTTMIPCQILNHRQDCDSECIL